MVFSSLIFLYAFLPLNLLSYALCRSMRAKNIVLLIFSLIFYAWAEPKYVLLLAAMALIDWLIALRIEKNAGAGKRKAWLAAACVFDVVLLVVFKYAGLFCSLFGDVPQVISQIVLPIGISFYTFQLLTYVIDVYRGDAPAQRSYFNILLYASLFHQCVAGPIVRYKTVARELFDSRSAYSDILPGIARFAVGLAKKVLLANACGAVAGAMLLTETAVESAPYLQSLAALSALPVLGAWLGVIAYALQIYLDFSAYSDMAIGLGQMIGVHYMENFRYPYCSRSVTEFWQRWHISLGTFFRDYVYIPMGGNRKGMPRTILNLFIVWSLTGLWHGASWNFLLWGLYYFMLIVMERLFLRGALEKLPAFFSHIYLLLAAAFGWIIFRFSDVTLAFTVFKGLFGANGNPLSGFGAVTVLKSNIFLLAFSAIASTPLLKSIYLRFSRGLGEAPQERPARAAVCWCVVPILFLAASTAALVGSSYNPFIYFRF